MEKEIKKIKEDMYEDIYDKMVALTGNDDVALEMDTLNAILSRVLFRLDKEEDSKIAIIGAIYLLSKEAGIDRVNGEALFVFEFRRISQGDVAYGYALTGGYLKSVLDKMTNEEATMWVKEMKDRLIEVQKAIDTAIQYVEAWPYTIGRDDVACGALKVVRYVMRHELGTLLCNMGDFEGADLYTSDSSVWCKGYDRSLSY